MKRLGFGFREKMSGTWEGARGSGKFSFDLDVRCPDVTSPLDIVGTTEGSVTMEGIADRAPAEGKLEISPFWRRRIRYTLAFTGADGKRYRFEGAKKIAARKLLTSWTTLPGRVYDIESGAPIADVVARFDVRKLPALLRSFRPARALRANDAHAAAT